MKSMILAVALSASGIALAQTSTQTGTQDMAQPSGQTSAPTGTQDAAQPSGQTSSQTGMQDAAQPRGQTAPRTGTQGTAQPSGETVDDPSQSTGPRGVTQQGTVPDNQTRAGAGDYPACSRTVTDGCIQTYERGVRASRPRRR